MEIDLNKCFIKSICTFFGGYTETVWKNMPWLEHWSTSLPVINDNLFTICWHGYPGCNPSFLQSTILQQPLVMQSLCSLQRPVVWPVPFSPPDPSSLENLKAQLKYHFLLQTFFHSPSWTIGMNKDLKSFIVFLVLQLTLISNAFYFILFLAQHFKNMHYVNLQFNFLRSLQLMR